MIKMIQKSKSRTKQLDKQKNPQKNKDESKVFWKSGEMDWLGLETPMAGTEGEILTFWRSRLLENTFPQQFQIFFKYQNPENKLFYVTIPEFRINPEIFHPCKKVN